MENVRAMPNRPISARRMRTQAEWNVETHISLARLPTSSITRPRISAAALLVKVMARIEPGCTSPLADQVGDPAGQHPRLARAGAGHDQHRRALVQHRLTLRRVQPVQQLLCVRGGRLPGAGAGHGRPPGTGRPADRQSGEGTRGWGALVIVCSTLDAGTDSLGYLPRSPADDPSRSCLRGRGA